MNWVDGFEIRTRVDGKAIVVCANREGLLSLANLCAALAESAPGSHVHLDEYNALEEGSMELIVERSD